VLLGVVAAVPVGVAVTVRLGVNVPIGVAVAVGVGLGEAPDCAQYLPPLPNSLKYAFIPPHTIMSEPVHTAVRLSRSSGALMVLVAVQLLLVRAYLVRTTTGRTTCVTTQVKSPEPAGSRLLITNH
jgi:hypothetical protein